MATRAAETIEVPGPDGTRQVRLTSGDRVLWPDAGVTKRDLAEYVVAVGPHLLAGLQGRPVTLQRFPTGVQGEAFYNKHPPKGMPDWAATTTVTYPSGRTGEQLVIDEVATAVWCVQMGTITWHPWPVRAAAPDNPDELRIDLDPQPGVPWQQVLDAAAGLRGVLADAGLTGWPKTTGSRGIHVYVSIEAEREFLEVRHAVIALARELERRMPDAVTTAWWKEQRGDKVFIDYNQASRDRTIAAAYSPRPLPGAPVSTPVTWDELATVDPAGFTVRTVPALVAERDDPWRGRAEAIGSLTQAWQWWERDAANGLPEMAFPPDYPKMPGEPPRVQPSRARSTD